MAAVEIRKVTDKKGLEAFIQFHYDLYRGNKFDAPNLYADEIHTLSKDKNAAFEFCEAEYFLAYKDGKVVGRVAAIINNRANERWERKSVRFGWIDFIDDIEVSTALLDAVTEWGRSKGMTEVVGPLGFTDMDPEGMLIEGFEELGTMATIYNYPYYPEHLKKMGGWVKDNDYVEYKLIVPKEGMPEKFRKRGTTGRLVILRAKVAKLDAAWKDAAPGTVVKIDKMGPVVRCHDTALQLLEVKPEGSSQMDGGSFCRGRQLAAGETQFLME